VTFEQLLTDTLHAIDDYAPSPDLFAKVQRSIEEDRTHRRRIRETILWLAAAVAAVVVYLLVTVRVEDGRVDMSFTSLELLVTAVMIAIVAVMGPAIRRFGQTYEQAVLGASRETGMQVLRLLDIAYYLVFGAYIVMTLQFTPPRHLPFFDRQFADALLAEVQRLGGLLLLMGLLHVVLLLALPVVGLVHRANLRRARIAEGATSDDDVAAKIDRGVTIGVWIVAVPVLFLMVVVVLGVLLALGAGG
jgi:heme/copper-type cytochrome/quinol oxidase subunit 2